MPNSETAALISSSEKSDSNEACCSVRESHLDMTGRELVPALDYNLVKKFRNSISIAGSMSVGSIVRTSVMEFFLLFAVMIQ